jgi:hypothetical protein
MARASFASGIIGVVRLSWFATVAPRSSFVKYGAQFF